MGLGKVSD